MKILLIMASLLLLVNPGFSKEKKPMGKLETNIKLNGSSIHGKSLSPMSLDTLVEDDKYLSDLVGVRKDFNDKIEKDKKRKFR